LLRRGKTRLTKNKQVFILLVFILQVLDIVCVQGNHEILDKKLQEDRITSWLELPHPTLYTFFFRCILRISLISYVCPSISRLVHRFVHRLIHRLVGCLKIDEGCLILMTVGENSGWAKKIKDDPMGRGGVPPYH